jgi:hypothetical protein
MINLTQALKMFRSITLTPIGREGSTKPPRLDYDNQRINESNGFNMIWDDAEENETQVSDAFGFIFGAGSHGKGEAQISSAVAVLPQSARDPLWQIPEHANRQVIVLSPTIIVVTWVDLCRELGWKFEGRVDGRGVRTPPLRGTRRSSI